LTQKPVPQNLLKESWTDLDSNELRVLLRECIAGGLGQYDGDHDKLYFPAAGRQCRIVLTYADSKIAAVEPGEAFDLAEWERISQKIEGSILAGTPKTGRDFSFSNSPVRGSWRGRHSGVQIVPAPENAPRAEGTSNPFILEFPIKGSNLPAITDHRRIREHGKLTLLLNVLLAGTTSAPLQRAGHFWAHIPRDDGGPPDIRWVQEWYYAPLDHIVLDEPSAPAAERLEEVEPEKYYTNVGNDLRGLRVPADLDESIAATSASQRWTGQNTTARHSG
jgi:hypothetical protein